MSEAVTFLYQVKVPTRQQWQAKRTSFKIPKGIAKVSMGDALQKFHATYRVATIQKHIQEAKNLEAACDTYIAALRAKYAKDPAKLRFVHEVEEIKKEARYHANSLGPAVVQAKMEFYKRFQAADGIITNFEKHRSVDPKDVVKAIERLNACTEAFARIELDYGRKHTDLVSIRSRIQFDKVISPEYLKKLTQSMDAINPRN